MPLPLVCPKSNKGICTGNDCPMHLLDWRSKEEYCMVDYYPAKTRKKMVVPEVEKLIIKPEHKSEIKPEKTERLKNLLHLKDIPEDYEEKFWG